MSPAPSGTLVFSHANSFPAGTYSLLFERWRAAGWEVHAVDKYGHDPRYPVTRDWTHLLRQLQDTVQSLGRPVHLVGHSLGGYLSMMLASQQPASVLGLVVLDSPLVHGWKADGLGLAKRLGLMPVIMPSRISRHRRHQWPDAQSAHQHFANKKKFAAFHPQVLSDYLRHGTQSSPQGGPTSLAFRRDVESDIYDHLPHRIQRQLRHHPLQCPAAYIGGTRSSEIRQVGLRGTRKVFKDHISWVEGSHLYPFERPDETASQVLKWLSSFTDAAPPP